VGVGVARCPPEGGGCRYNSRCFFSCGPGGLRSGPFVRPKPGTTVGHGMSQKTVCNVGFLLTGIETMVDVLEWPRLIGLE
jgi:hypothetical protein